MCISKRNGNYTFSRPPALIWEIFAGPEILWSIMKIRFLNLKVFKFALFADYSVEISCRK